MRLLLAEDSTLLREALTALLERLGHTIAATAQTAPDLLAAFGLLSDAGEPPDLVLTDVRMPPGFADEGVRAALAIRRRWPEVAIMLLSQYVEERYASELLATQTSAIGYLLKDRVADVATFLESLHRVADGGTALDPEVVSQLLVRRRSSPLDRLTARERDVLALMAEGRSNAGIAEQLVVSESAVAKHINNIFAKLDLPMTESDHRRVLAVLRFLNDASA